VRLGELIVEPESERRDVSPIAQLYQNEEDAVICHWSATSAPLSAHIVCAPGSGRPLCQSSRCTLSIAFGTRAEMCLRSCEAVKIFR